MPAAAQPGLSRTPRFPPSAEGPAPPIVHEVLASPGLPLDPATRARFDPAFGQSLHDVRSHTDPRAAASAAAVGALAYTVGQHIVFAAGAYAPGTPQGDTLLAHELAHTRQQAAAQPDPSVPIHGGHVAAEEAAAQTDERLVRGGSAGPLAAAPHGLYRVPPPGAPPATIPAGRRVIVQWGDDPATVKNTEALRSGARSGPNAAGSDRVVHHSALTPDSLADAREVIIVIHGETELTPEGNRVVQPGSDQPQATHGAPGLPAGAAGPIEAISAQAMAKRLVEAGFGKGRWTNYRVRLAMCYGGVGEASSYSAELNRAIAALGVSNETIGYRGQVTAVGGVRITTAKPPAGAQPAGASAAPGELVAANFYPVYDGTSFGAPGTRARRDVTRATVAPEPGGAAPVPTVPVPEGEGPAPPKVSALGEHGIEAPPGGGSRAGTALGLFGLFMMFASLLPDPLEEEAIKHGIAKALSALDVAIRVEDLQDAVDKATGNVYYNIQFRIAYRYISSPAVRTVPTIRQVESVEVIRIDLSANKLAWATDVDQPERPDSATPRYGGGYTWLAHSTMMASSQVQSGGQRAEQLAREKRDKEQREIADKLRQLGKAGGEPAKPKPEQPKPPPGPPSLLPPEPAPPPSFLPGQPGPGPVDQAAAWVARARSVGESLVSRGAALVNRLGSAQEPSKEERTSFLNDSQSWLLMVKYQQNWYAEHGPDSGVSGLKQLLEDPAAPGTKLAEPRRLLGAD